MMLLFSILRKGFIVPSLLLGLVSSTSPSLAHRAIEPVSRSADPSWQARHELLNSRTAQMGEKAKIIFIGDSITQAWENEGKDVWAKYYEPRGALDLGIGGDQTQHVLWRLGNGNIKGLKPKVAILMIGTNNIPPYPEMGATVGQIADGVRAIVQKLRHDLPDTRILLVGIFPRGENPNSMRGSALQVNQIIRKLADGKMIYWTDFGDRFVNDDGTIPSNLMPDMLHLSPAGYQIWAEAIEDQVAEILKDKKR